MLAPPSLINLEEIRFVGEDLKRPECVLATADGSLYTADWRGGVARIHPDGSQSLTTGSPALKPNGISLEPDGSLLVADISDATAGVWRLHPSGDVSSFLLEVDGQQLPPVNFVCRDEAGRIWITVSTRLQPRARDYRPDASTGFIVLVDEKGPRVVADGLGYANECRVDPKGRWLYVNETFTRRLTRFRIGADGSLRDRELVAGFGRGTFPDGLAFDVDGGVWITSIVSNRLIRVDRDGAQTVLLEDNEPEYLDLVEQAFQSGTMGRAHLDGVQSRYLKSISSIAFGGPDLKTLFLGCLLGDRLAVFDSPIAGVPPVHWHYSF